MAYFNSAASPVAVLPPSHQSSPFANPGYTTSSTGCGTTRGSPFSQSLPASFAPSWSSSAQLHQQQQQQASVNHAALFAPSGGNGNISNTRGRKRAHRDDDDDEVSLDRGTRASQAIMARPILRPTSFSFSFGVNSSSAHHHQQSTSSSNWFGTTSMNNTTSGRSIMPPRRNNKLQRLDSSSSSSYFSTTTTTTTSNNPSSSSTSSIPTPITPPKDTLKSGPEDPIIDAFTLRLGISWTRISNDTDESKQAAARGWAKYIENNFPDLRLEDVKILLQSKRLDDAAYLVGSKQGFFVFDENLTTAKMVGRNEEEALACLANGGGGVGLAETGMGMQGMTMPVNGAVQEMGMKMNMEMEKQVEMTENIVEKGEKMMTEGGMGGMGGMMMMNTNDNDDTIMTLNESNNNNEQTTHDDNLIALQGEDGDGSMEID
ncbi:MAG: pkb-activating kinase-like protein [Watsoniomyces obsoletus]|nr:MAG: pkb-activating kinase-like protein [Watsoniomyces obsoletus]